MAVKPILVSIPFIAGQWSLRLAWGKVLDLSGLSQSPSLRGSGRFVDPRFLVMVHILVSIPFIAGQWSLPYHHGCHG